jgi:hypothetical protein
LGVSFIGDDSTDQRRRLADIFIRHLTSQDVLKLMENDSGERRNPEKYYFSVFGTPKLL